MEYNQPPDEREEDAFGHEIDLSDTDEEFVKENGFSRQELAAALKVLKLCDENPQRLKSKQLRELRTLGTKVFQPLCEKFYEGMTPAEYSANRLAKMEEGRKRAEMKQADRKWVNSAQIRKERIEALSKLMLDTPTLPALTDGSEESSVIVQEEPATSEAPQNGEETSSPAKNPKVLNFLRSCYMCKSRFNQLHWFYDNLCPSCAEVSYQKRNQMADLTGRVAVVTGGRIKIGFEITLRLLRCGATVLMTTRFPHDATLRLQREKDFDQWKDRIQVFGLDLRDLRSVEEFVQIVKSKFRSINIIVNNAAQSVRKPPSFYSHLMPTEMQPISSLPEAAAPLLQLYSETSTRQVQMISEYKEEAPKSQLVPVPEAPSITLQNTTNRSAFLSQIPVLEGDDQHDPKAFPEGRFDPHHQQLDLRQNNSWLMKIEEVPTIELLENIAINSASPFIICGKLRDLLKESSFKDRYIVNVSAMEGKFYRHKTPNHPHTNMAKAALNMMVRTCAEDFAKDNIYLNAVDTGWVTDENPYDKATAHTKTTNFMAPLDEMEGMARVLDPILFGVNTGTYIYGKFLKNYVESEW